MVGKLISMGAVMLCCATAHAVILPISTSSPNAYVDAGAMLEDPQLSADDQFQYDTELNFTPGKPLTDSKNIDFTRGSEYSRASVAVTASVDEIFGGLRYRVETSGSIERHLDNPLAHAAAATQSFVDPEFEVRDDTALLRLTGVMENNIAKPAGQMEFYLVNVDTGVRLFDYTGVQGTQTLNQSIYLDPGRYEFVSKIGFSTQSNQIAGDARIQYEALVVPPSAVPEPVTAALVGVSMLGASGRILRRIRGMA